MARVLFWNLMNFTDRRINNPKNIIASTKSLNNILGVFKNDPPDVFVLIELFQRTGGSKQGELVKGSAANGAITLLGAISKYTKSTWHLIPPVVTGFAGKREGIAVYYNGSTTLTFTGPWTHTGAKGAATQAKGKGLAYPKPWNNTLPKGSTAGGQWEFRAGKVIQEYPVAGERRPWLVSFKDTGGAVVRNIDVFGFHAPAPGPNAGKGTVALSTTNEIVNSKNYCVLGGDFNVPYTPKNKKNIYGSICNVGYSWEFKNNDNYTTQRNVKQSSISAKGLTYPQYGYGANTYDQIFTKLVKMNNPMVIDQVIGTDNKFSGFPPAGILGPGFGFDSVPPLANGTAAFTYPCYMANDIPTILAGANPNKTFQNFANYGHIRRTSDHMGVVMDV
ncbi:MAG: hypothetical protein D3910_04180 [Candidatus Electrothrix sp. ATG2]|nr:hypothetical protein [Candidatus Electrothrix sp. ATG2]